MFNRCTGILMACLGMAAFCIALSCQAGGAEDALKPAAAPQPVATRTRLATVTERVGESLIVHSTPRGYRVAWIESRGGRAVVVVDGRAGQIYDRIKKNLDLFGSDIQFSPDGNRTAYVAIRGGKMVAVIDGEPELEYDEIPDIPRFSPDSRHVFYKVYKVGDETKQFYVVNGKAGPMYDSLDYLDYLVFSADGSRMAYSARKGDKWFMMVDGRPGPEFDEVSHAQFSPDGRRLAYFAVKEEKSRVIIDGQSESVFDYVDRGSVVFSPDSRRLAYVAMNDDKARVVVDGKPGPEFDEIRSDRLAHVIGEDPDILFSPDSKRVAYRARKGVKECVVMDGQVGPEYDHVGPPRFSSDSKQSVYFAQKYYYDILVINGRPTPEGLIWTSESTFSPDGKRLAFAANSAGGLATVMIDGQAGQGFDSVDALTLVFSPDSKRIAYIASLEEKKFVVVDGQIHKPDVILDRHTGLGEILLFSPDGRRLAYTGRLSKMGKVGEGVVIVDDKAGPEFDSIEEGSLVFSGDGKHLAYAIRRVKKPGFYEYHVVVDGQVSPGYKDIPGPPLFRLDGKLEYIVVEVEKEARAVYRVVHEFP